MVGLVAVNLRWLPRSSAYRSPCGLREVDDVGVESSGVPG